MTGGAATFGLLPPHLLRLGRRLVNVTFGARLPILTVRQPYASAIVSWPGSKNIENRSWSTNRRGLIGIHAGKQPAADIRPHDRSLIARQSALLPLGKVLGAVLLLDCHRAGSDHCVDVGCSESRWAEFPPEPIWHWELAHPIQFQEPIDAVGHMGFWYLSDEQEALVAKQVHA